MTKTSEHYRADLKAARETYRQTGLGYSCLEDSSVVAYNVAVRRMEDAYINWRHAVARERKAGN